MEIKLQQPCPTCGAKILLNEDDRVVECEYCDVSNYMTRRSLPRFVLPPDLPSHISQDQLYYAPYLRFKGTIYYCQDHTVYNRFIDTTRVGHQLDSLPVSLGMRPQAMELIPVTGQLQGRYIRQTIKANEIFRDAARLTTLFSKNKRGAVVERSFIGETISRIYLPLYIYNGAIYDGVTNARLRELRDLSELDSVTMNFNPDWEPHFLSTICPACGDTMRGSRDTLVMNCTNCASIWREERGRFEKVEYRVVKSTAEMPGYLPFWHIEPQVEGCQLRTVADFIKLTNQPVVAGKEHQKKLAFILPAFKVKPATYLQASKTFTSMQLLFDRAGHMVVRDHYPVTMPFSEAVQSLKTILAASAVSSKEVFELLPDIRFKVEQARLLFLPFTWLGYDLRQEQTGFAFSKAALRFGRSL